MEKFIYRREKKFSKQSNINILFPLIFAAEICNQCSRHFVNKNNAAFLLMDIDCDVVFCGIKCMVHYLMTVEKTSACVQCSTIGNHFTMIRSARNITRRSWCSMKCALNDKSFLITEEAVIDLTLEREEFFGKIEENVGIFGGFSHF